MVATNKIVRWQDAYFTGIINSDLTSKYPKIDLPSKDRLINNKIYALSLL